MNRNDAFGFSRKEASRRDVLRARKVAAAGLAVTVLLSTQDAAAIGSASVNSIDTFTADASCNVTGGGANIAVSGVTVDYNTGVDRDAAALVLTDSQGNILAFNSNIGPEVSDSVVGVAPFATTILPTTPVSRPFVLEWRDTTVQLAPESAVRAAPVVASFIFDPASFEPACSSLPFVAVGTDTRRRAIAVQQARVAIEQTVGLTFGRTRDYLRDRGRDPGGRAGVATSSDAWSVGRGGAGQAAAPAIGVWADFGWSGQNNDAAALDAGTTSFTLAGGADREIASGVLFGTSVSLGWAESDAGNETLKSRELNVNISPYAAVRLDDRFALQAVAGYGYGDGKSERPTGSGDYAAHRYYAAVEASFFDEIAQDFYVYGAVGALWGRSHRTRFTATDGIRVGSQRVDVGSASVIAQPSYLFVVDSDEGVFVEPYALVEYSYDFETTAIEGVPVDRDAFRIGAGANILAGDAVSGGVEATRSLGRENERETTARATVRMDF